MNPACRGAPQIGRHHFTPKQVAQSRRRCVEHGALILYVQGYRSCRGCNWQTFWTHAVCPQMALAAGKVPEAFAIDAVESLGCPRCVRRGVAA